MDGQSLKQALNIVCVLTAPGSEFVFSSFFTSLVEKPLQGVSRKVLREGIFLLCPSAGVEA
jgi:hypothetical protein